MGVSCSSCDATTVAEAAAATAKLVLQDGKLLEFARPVKASQVLQKDPSCFVCSADDMEFDDFVSPVNADEELQPGQLYFLLPASMLRRRLHADDMASLAVKASAALMGSGRCAGHCHNRSAAAGRLVFPDVASGAGKAGGRLVAGQEQQRRRRPSSGSGGHRGRDFKSELCGIPE